MLDEGIKITERKKNRKKIKEKKRRAGKSKSKQSLACLHLHARTTVMDTRTHPSTDPKAEGFSLGWACWAC